MTHIAKVNAQKKRRLEHSALWQAHVPLLASLGDASGDENVLPSALHVPGGAAHVTCEPAWVTAMPDAPHSLHESERVQVIHEQACGCHLDALFRHTLAKVHNPRVSHQLEDWRTEIAHMEVTKMHLGEAVKAVNDPHDAAGNLVPLPLTKAHASEWCQVNESQLKVRELFMNQFLVISES